MEMGLSLFRRPLVLFMGLILVLKDVEKDATVIEGGGAVDGWGTCVIPVHQGWWSLWRRASASYTPGQAPPRTVFFARPLAAPPTNGWLLPEPRERQECAALKVM